MARLTGRELVIEKLKVRFPNIKGIRKGEELGHSDDSIFLGDVAEGGTIGGLPACNFYAEDPREEIYIMGVHKELDNFLCFYGWHVEAHDPGTYLAYE